ncbi:hypothetical protein F4814DRAFT_405320, partial [Daldinia grandis]
MTLIVSIADHRALTCLSVAILLILASHVTVSYEMGWFPFTVIFGAVLNDYWLGSYPYLIPERLFIEAQRSRDAKCEAGSS